MDRTTGKIFCFFAYAPRRPGVGYSGSTPGGTSATATTNTHIRYVAGAAGYSTMAVLPDGTTAALYEIGDTGGIVFTRQSLSWLES
ncbi:hypothetical protein ACQEU6_03785 [Spirillospora sp. CA-108201]